MARKEAGGRSSQQNDFLEPKKPSVSAVNVGTDRAFNNGAATVTITLPGDSPPATSFSVTATPSSGSPVTVTNATSPITVTGLLSNTNYTFTATASNAAGTSPASDATGNVLITTVPATMSAPTATAGVNQDTVTWTAPATGGSAITLYRWESNESPVKTGTTESLSAVVINEANTTQAYRVRAENANGAGVYSPYSNNVTTVAPFFPFFPHFPPHFPPFFPPFFPHFPPFFPRFPFFPFFPRFYRHKFDGQGQAPEETTETE
jgi:hypothetical protein